MAIVDAKHLLRSAQVGNFPSLRMEVGAHIKLCPNREFPFYWNGGAGTNCTAEWCYWNGGGYGRVVRWDYFRVLLGSPLIPSRISGNFKIVIDFLHGQNSHEVPLFHH